MNHRCGTCGAGQPCSQDKGKPPEKAGRKATDPWASVSEFSRDSHIASGSPGCRGKDRVASFAWYQSKLPRRVRRKSETRLPNQYEDRFTSIRFNSRRRIRPIYLGVHLTREERDMKNFADSVVNFLKEEDGPTAVEYAVMLASDRGRVLGRCWYHRYQRQRPSLKQLARRSPLTS